MVAARIHTKLTFGELHTYRVKFLKERKNMNTNLRVQYGYSNGSGEVERPVYSGDLISQFAAKGPMHAILRHISMKRNQIVDEEISRDGRHESTSVKGLSSSSTYRYCHVSARDKSIRGCVGDIRDHVELRCELQSVKCIRNERRRRSGAELAYCSGFVSEILSG
jgi:hypothetical protein